MSEPIFSYPPDVELLQWLVQGSLKQNLLQAIRLWVWLRSLYGDETIRVKLPQTWTYADWRNVFFSDTHLREEKLPPLHDCNCFCAKTAADWLFASGTKINENEWRRAITSYYLAQDCNLNNYQKLNTFQNGEELLIFYPNAKDSNGKKQNLNAILQHRLFAVNPRTLRQDLHILKNRGWIKANEKGYQLLNELPIFNFSINYQKNKVFNLQELTFSNANLETTIEIFSEPIGGYRRFYLEVEYIIPDYRDDVDDCQNVLKEVWSEIPNRPVKFTYKSAKLERPIERIIYPVCIYYARRAIYLSAFGQTPNEQGEWYNYRLDRISNLTKLDWSDTSLPEVLIKRYPHQLPTPEYIREQLSEAWGYDFFEQRRLLVLRFERNFHHLYIKGTFRHETFKKIRYEQVKKIIERQPMSEQKNLEKILNNRSPNDAYYQVYYRDKDVNIIQRLRSWRPNGEVLLPWDLRTKLAQEAIQEVQLYQNFLLD